MSAKDIYTMSDKAITSELWERVENLRLEQNVSQAEMADALGIDVRTYRRTITGGGSLERLIAILRVLGKLEYINTFIPQERVYSPLELAKLKGKERQRASKKKVAELMVAEQTEELDW